MKGFKKGMNVVNTMKARKMLSNGKRLVGIVTSNQKKGSEYVSVNPEGIKSSYRYHESFWNFYQRSLDHRPSINLRERGS